MTALTHLSLRRLGTHRHRVPQPPTNTERLAAFRAHQPVVFANTALADRIRAAAYQRDAMADAAPTTDVHYRETL